MKSRSNWHSPTLVSSLGIVIVTVIRVSESMPGWREPSIEVEREYGRYTKLKVLQGSLLEIHLLLIVSPGRHAGLFRMCRAVCHSDRSELIFLQPCLGARCSK
jgi:hypothetical protein